MQNYKHHGGSGHGMGLGSAAMGTGAMDPSIVAGSRDSGLSTEAIRNELKMLENKERQMDEFD